MLTMTTFHRLYTTDAPLTITGVLMAAALIPALAGLWLDPRVITGAPAWLKPAKFAMSTAIYVLTLAWIFTYLPEWVRTRRIVGWATAVILIVEVGAIPIIDGAVREDCAFHALVDRYPLAERARGFLIAKGLEAEDGL